MRRASAQPGRRLGRRAERDVEDVAALEVAGGADAPVAEQPLDLIRGDAVVLEGRAGLVLGPDVEAALLALGVGVERGVEAALGAVHLAERPVERVAGDLHPALVAGPLPAVQVGAGQQRVVVEHLLEVGDEPLGVDRVAGEAAADLVVDAAAHHPVERAGDVLALAAGHQELEDARGRELGGVAEPAVSRIGRREQAADRAVEDRLRQVVGRLLDPRDRREALADAVGCLAELLALVAVAVGGRLHHLAEARHALARLGREVGAAVERDALGVEEDGERPAALAGHPLDGLHVDVVDVGALLAVDLDRDEPLVHVGGGVLVLEGLALHHVAPVAGGVPDREQDRLVGLPRLAAGPPAPTAASRPGCPCAGGGRGWSRREAVGHASRLPAASVMPFSLPRRHRRGMSAPSPSCRAGRLPPRPSRGATGPRPRPRARRGASVHRAGAAKGRPRRSSSATRRCSSRRRGPREAIERQAGCAAGRRRTEGQRAQVSAQAT